MRTVGIDRLGTPHTLPRTHFPERSEVADACVPQLVARTCFQERSSGVIATMSNENFYEPLNRRPCTDPECIFYHQILCHIMGCYVGNWVHGNYFAIQIFIAHCDHCSDDEWIHCFPLRDYVDSPFYTSFNKLYIMCLSPEWIRPNIPGFSDQ